MSGTSIFPIMKIVQGYSYCSDKTFIIDQIEKKIKESKKKLNFPIHSKHPRLGRKNFRTEGRTDLIHIYDPSGHG